MFLQQSPGSWNIKRLLLINHAFSTSLSVGRCKNLGSLKSFPWCVPQLAGASILCFLILSTSRYIAGGGCSVWWLQYPLFTDLARNIFHSKWLWNRLSLVVRGSSGHMPMNHRSFYYTLPYDQICKPWFKLQISTYPLLLVLDSCWNR